MKTIHFVVTAAALRAAHRSSFAFVLALAALGCGGPPPAAPDSTAPPPSTPPTVEAPAVPAPQASAKAAEPAAAAPATPAAKPDSEYAVDGVSLSVVPIDAVEKAFKKTGAKQFDAAGRRVQTIGPWEQMLLEFQTKDGKSVSFTLRRPAKNPKTTAHDVALGAQYSPKELSEHPAGTLVLYDDRSDVAVTLLIGNETGGALGRKLFESIAQKR